MTTPENHWGRWLTARDIDPSQAAAYLQEEALFEEKGRWHCRRCAYTLADQDCLPDGRRYCRQCLLMGRLCQGDQLYHSPQQPFPQASYLRWTGQLTRYQAQVSQDLCQSIADGQATLVHAVTGAGKTEMIYASLDQVLRQGGACAVVSPRIDVCIELHKRLTRDFACDIQLLHGESDPYARSPLVVATTHQLYRFYQAFDLVIVDEVDAFPFVDDASLYHAVATALKPQAVQVFLTATSTDALEEQVAQGQLRQLDLPRRFHGSPLVVPDFCWLGGLEKGLTKGSLPQSLLEDIRQQRQTSFPLLLFFPHIERGQVFTGLLQDALPDQAIGFVSSQSADRLDQVEAFRQGDLDILVTTTILERGVTFPGVDVFVLWANHRLYTKSSLVQIAGRVGRSQDRPDGLLRFYHDGRTRAMVCARQAIQNMNAKGGFA